MNIDSKRLLDDLKNSLGLPVRFYVDPDIFQFELNSIWRREWQYFAPSEKLRNPGDVEIGFAGDVPVVVVRGMDQRLRGFVNMCRHRGYRVQMEGGKNCRRLVCGYHSWTYALDGRLIGAPGSHEDDSFDRNSLGLLPISVEELGPAVFVNADPNALSRAEALPGCMEAYNEVGIDLDPDRYMLTKASTHSVSSNWKVWYDNFIECYHCGTIHAGSFAAAYELDPATIKSTIHDRFVTTKFPAKASASSTELRASNYRSANHFPGSLILQQDDLMILSQMRPLGPECTEQKVDYFAEVGADPERVDRWIDLWERTFIEDGEATAIQQSGLRTGVLERNRLLRAREECVFYFNELVCQSYEGAVSKSVHK